MNFVAVQFAYDNIVYNSTVLCNLVISSSPFSCYFCLIALCIRHDFEHFVEVFIIERQLRRQRQRRWNKLHNAYRRKAGRHRTRWNIRRIIYGTRTGRRKSQLVQDIRRKLKCLTDRKRMILVTQKMKTANKYRCFTMAYRRSVVRKLNILINKICKQGSSWRYLNM